MPKGISEKSDGKQSGVGFRFFVCKFVQFQCGFFIAHPWTLRAG